MIIGIKVYFLFNKPLHHHGPLGEHDQWLLAMHGQLISKVYTEGQTCIGVNVISCVQCLFSQQKGMKRLVANTSDHTSLPGGIALPSLSFSRLRGAQAVFS